MSPVWLSAVAGVSVAAGVVAAIVIAADIYAGRRQNMPIMNFVWPLTGLWSGPVGLWAYFASGRARAGSRGLGLRDGIVAAVKADAASLAAWQLGMYGWMAVALFALFSAPALPKSSPVFWFMMQIAMFAGFATAFPVNWWLLRHGIKEAM